MEEMGVDELVQFHVAIVTFDDFRSRLEGMDDVTRQAAVDAAHLAVMRPERPAVLVPVL